MSKYYGFFCLQDAWDVRGANITGFGAMSTDLTGANLADINIEENLFQDAVLWNTKTP